ncbi:hypothetical protein [Candidatus Nitrotoga sp. M5]|uniref:hypothetical protein n=1 Tax=Candidatus Nitrotoga sp. M5 TaxID=2890409 RepID=UPI001EF17E33|nr:hypothetical protein [Candidatus Nitrotoga sp. M5]CAH1386977.1 Eukaryotic translation initiation factor 3 110 kDa subunit [Candidatus Nitrotoga sp. M5]
MKKNIINLAIVSCFTLAAMSAYADSDRSMSNRSMSDRSMSVESDSDRSRNTNSSRSNRSQQDDRDSTSKGNSNQKDYYKTHKYGKTSDNQGSVDSAKDVQSTGKTTGKILKQEELDIECRNAQGDSDFAEGNTGRDCQP